LGCRHVAGEDTHGGGLAGAIRSEETEHFARFHTETHVIYGGERAVAFREVLHLDHERFLVFGPSRAVPGGTPRSLHLPAVPSSVEREQDTDVSQRVDSPAC